MMMKSCRSSQSTQQTNNFFMPWGIKARKVLHSVIYGEVPSCSELNNIYYSGKQELDGGIVRCMVSGSVVDSSSVNPMVPSYSNTP